MKYQQVLTMTTDFPSLRSEVIGWKSEDPSLCKLDNKPIGLSGGMATFYWQYDCPLRAMADGWFLLAPPNPIKFNGESFYQWWFVKEIEKG